MLVLLNDGSEISSTVYNYCLLKTGSSIDHRSLSTESDN